MRALATVLVACATLAACSGVPRSSLPQVVRTVDGPGVTSATATLRPEPGDDQRATVSKFLQAQVTNDKSHQAAKAFLSASASTKWQDNTVTVLDDYRVNYANLNDVVVVSGRVIGTLDTNGIYTPTLTGSGLSSEKSFPFSLAQVAGQWRITDPPSGVIVRQRDFATSFHPRMLSFFNQAETKLVPDLRYSPLDGQSLAFWMLEQLIAGPQQQQQNALRNEFPDQIDPQRAKVTLSQPIAVQLPGLSQVDTPTVIRIAAEIGYSFGSFASALSIALFDGTRAIQASTGSVEFTAADFPQFDPVPATLPSLYYMRDGTVMNSQGAQINGKGASQYALGSVAVAGSADSDLRLAGLTSQPNTLYVGTASAGLHPVPLAKAATTRPEWVVAAVDEVWLGTGTSLVRVASDRVEAIPFASAGTDLSGRTVTSVRVSPEGARIAMVLTDPDGSGSVWVGSVVRSGGAVQVGGLRQITPRGWQVRDVSWAANGTALRAIGSETDGPQIEIWSLNCDGSAPAEPNSDNLPALPDWITATTDGSTWVSVSNRIWREQSLGGWVNPFPAGTAPIYSVG